MRSALLLFTFAAMLGAQQGRVSGPVSGFLRDGKAVRAILGIPGASHLSAALATDVDYAAVSMDGRRAFISSGNQISLMSIADGTQRSLGEGSSRAARWNDLASALAFEKNGHVLLYRADDESMADLGSLNGAVTALAVDGAGRTVFAAVDGVEGGIYRLAENEPALLLARANSPSSLSLDSRRSALYLTSDAQALEISSLAAGGASRVAPDATDAAGIAVSANSRYLMVADRSARAVLIYENASRALLRKIDLDFEPTRMESLGNDVFLLNARSDGQALEILTMQPEPAVYFIPAAVEE